MGAARAQVLEPSPGPILARSSLTACGSATVPLWMAAGAGSGAANTDLVILVTSDLNGPACAGESAFHLTLRLCGPGPGVCRSRPGLCNAGQGSAACLGHVPSLWQPACVSAKQQQQQQTSSSCSPWASRSARRRLAARRQQGDAFRAARPRWPD